MFIHQRILMKKLLMCLLMLNAPLHLSAEKTYKDGFNDGVTFAVVTGALFYLGVPQAIVRIGSHGIDNIYLAIKEANESRKQRIMHGNFKKLVDALECCQYSNQREECLMSNKVNKYTVESAMESNDFKALKVKMEIYKDRKSLDLYYKIMQTLQQFSTEKASSK